MCVGVCCVTPDLYNQGYIRVHNRICACQCLVLHVSGFQGCVFVFVCACVAQRGTVLKDDRRVEQKSNHLIATFFISIFCFMAAEARRATPPVIHGRWGGRRAAPSLIGTQPPGYPKHPHNYPDEYGLFLLLFLFCFFILLLPNSFSVRTERRLAQPPSCRK